MKLYKSLLAATVLAVSSIALTGCDEDLAVPPMNIPSAPEGMKATMTIQDFKQKYWSDENNYCIEIPKGDDGEDIILGGIIIANDEGGNIYQNLMLQDETGAVCIATLTDRQLNLDDLNTRYKVGGEMFINATGLYAGKYAGLFQIGTKGDYNGTPQTSKMSASDFLSHTYLNGLPAPDKVQVLPMTISEINAAQSVADQQKYQSQMVKIDDVSFIGGGSETWGVVGSNTTATNRYLIDANGNQLLVRNSNRSDFTDQVLPAGHGNVRGILSYFNGTWQFMFQSPADCTDFGGDSYAPKIEGTGVAADPYTVGAVLAGASGSEQWVTGYIVGWVEGQAYASGAHFSVPASSQSNVLLAADPAETNPSNCIPVQLVSGTDVRNAVNLQANPGNLGKQVCFKGNLEAYFGVPGIKAPSIYTWGDKGDDSGTVTPPVGDNDGSAEKPFTVSETIAGSATGSSVWLTGYIVGAINDKSLSDAAFTAPFALASNILLAETAGETDIAKCVPVQLVAGTDVRNLLNLKDHPENLGKQVCIKGDIAKYFGANGMKTTSAYVWGDKGSAEQPVTGVQFRKVTSVTSGKQYVMVIDGNVGTPVPQTASYGRLSMSPVTISGDMLTTDEANAITFNAVSGGYTLTDTYGRKLAMDDSHLSSFQLDYAGGEVWTVAYDNGGFKIGNVLNSNCYIVRSGTFTNIAPSDIVTYPTYTLPELYEKVN